jgi:uncharacterized membrane protein YfcA
VSNPSLHGDLLWLLLAGFGGGLAGSIAGIASLVSYPALLALGLAPVAANVSNTVALVFNSVGSVWSSHPELAGQRGRGVRLGAVAIAGGVVGSALLLLTPSDTFQKIVPWLIAIAVVAILVQHDRSGDLTGALLRWPTWALCCGVFLVSIYSGYFGAAAGILMLALLLAGTGEVIARSNAMRNLVCGLSNAIAAVAFIAFGPVRWGAVIPLAVGCLIGGWLGPIIVRHVPARPLRLLIAVCGFALAVHLGWDAYR